MFKNKTRFLTTLILTTGAFSSFAMADLPIFSSTPAAPSELGATLVNDNTVRINFQDNSTNEDGFKIRGDINKTIGSMDSSGKEVYENITGLECDKVYQYEILAYNDDGESTDNETDAFRLSSTFGVICPEDDKPKAPGNIGVTDINKTAVRVNFVDYANNETSFKISGSGIDKTVPANGTVDEQVYVTLTGLTCDALYGIQVVASNNAGDSDASDLKYFRISSTFGVDCDE